MSTLLEALRLGAAMYAAGSSAREKIDAAIKEALAQPEQEPVAWAENDGDGNVLWNKDSCFSDDPEWLDNPMPLYTTPPYVATPRQRPSLRDMTWVGLTDEDKKEYVAQDFGGNRLDAMDWAEAKLKEKNTRNGGCL